MSIARSQSSGTLPTAPAERTFALGIGLTNECNLACSFCYRDPTRLDRLSLDQVRAVMQGLPVRSVNLGTGENGMHPEFAAMLSYLRRQPIKLTITSNSHSTIRPRRSRTSSAAPATGACSTIRPHDAAGSAYR